METHIVNIQTTSDIFFLHCVEWAILLMVINYKNDTLYIIFKICTEFISYQKYLHLSQSLAK